MTKQQSKQRIEKLKKLINRHRYLYNVLDKQEISDSALDSLKKELFDLEQMNPEFITPDSPTQRVSGKPLEKFRKIKHIEKMLSLNDAFSDQDMKDWETRIKKLLTAQEAKEVVYFCEIKFDGLAVELVYENNILKTGSTRGDGIIGEDITQNLKTIASIPLGIVPIPGQSSVVVRGEVIIPKKEFERINQEREKQGLPIYANPRNIAAGSLRQLDSKITASRNLVFFSYGLSSDLGQTTHQEEHRILKKLGFKTDSKDFLCQDLEEVFQFQKIWEKKRDDLEFEIDGLVCQVNENRIFKKLGIVGKAPRGAIAFKFSLKQAQTIVEDIRIQVGRTGAMTPVAHLRPVRVGGVVITRATLHNEDEIKRLQVKIGDTVIVGRAGDVIPDVIKTLKELRTGKERSFNFPKNCPECGSNLIRPEGDVVSRCLNSNCQERQRKNVEHFVGRSAFDIEGLGPKIIAQLFEEKLITDSADIFELKEGDLLPLQRFAEKSAQNLIQAIKQKKEIIFSKFIIALGIMGVGEETALDLARHFRNISNLKKVGFDELLKLQDIGPETANSIYSYFQEPKNLDFLKRLFRAGVRIESSKFQVSSFKLKGKTLVLTGSLQTLTRDLAKEKIRDLGGDVAAMVSKNTDFVVVGKEPGLKLQKAKKMGVKIINEKEFLKMLV